MKRINSVLLFTTAALLALAGASFAADPGSIKILSPMDGVSLQGPTVNKLTYTVQLGPEGNHLHVYIDDQKPIIVRNVTGCPCTVDLPALNPGKHVIVVKEARVDHSLTGVQSTVTVNTSQ